VVYLAPKAPVGPSARQESRRNGERRSAKTNAEAQAREDEWPGKIGLGAADPQRISDHLDQALMHRANWHLCRGFEGFGYPDFLDRII